jgi:7-cyano-7-deazaguanine reductase
MKEGKNLKQLGSKKTIYKLDKPSRKILESFDNKFPHRDYAVQISFPEFTSLCPKTGQPDFATISIVYTPNKKCIESKSLKLYFFAYRGYGSFMETITNTILEDLVAVLHPKRMKVIGSFNARGGVVLNVEAEYKGK